MSVEDFEDRVSSREFTGWIKYAEQEPFGYPLLMYMFSLQTQEIVNAVRSTIPVPRGKRRPPMMRGETLYPVRNKREPELTKEQQEHIRKKHGKRKK